MAVANRKLVSVYFDELQYLAFQYLSRQRKCNTADLIRDAMDSYLKSQKKKNDSFDDWQPLSVGGLKENGDWLDKNYQEEMLDGAYDRH